MSSVADRLVEALRTFDVDALAGLLAPDGTRWLNVGDSTRTAAEVLEITRVEGTLVASATLEVRQQSTTDDGFLLQLLFSGTTRSGREFRIPICLVARVVDDRITHYDEYADEASLEPLRAEFFAAQAS